MNTIFQYLDNELSPEERQAFETALTSDETLQKNLAQERAIREQFDFEKTKLSVLALHEKKKKQAEQERLIQEQFDFEKTKKEVLALHERKKAEQQKEAKIVALPQRNNWYRYAIAASLIGLMLTSGWFFYEKNKSQDVVNQELVKPKENINPIIVPPSDNTIKEEKAVVINKKPTTNKPQRTPSEEQFTAPNPTIDTIFDKFFAFQMKDVKSDVMANDASDFEMATGKLKNGKYQAAYQQLEILHKEKPYDADVTLFFALVAYKLDKKTEAISLLESIKEKNKEVEKFLEK